MEGHMYGLAWLVGRECVAICGDTIGQSLVAGACASIGKTNDELEIEYTDALHVIAYYSMGAEHF